MFNVSVEGCQAGKFISNGKSRHSPFKLDTWELIFIVSGTLDMFEGNRKYHLTMGDRLLLKPGILHGGLTDYANDLVFYWIHFHPRTEEFQKRLLKMPTQLAVRNRARSAEYCQLYLSLIAEEPTHQEARDLILELILMETGRKLFLKNPSAELPSAELRHPARLAEAAMRIIQLKYCSQLNTSVIAYELRCNPDYLGRVFQANFHLTVTEAIHQHRLQLVKKLLIEDTLSIKETAQRAGFDDMVNFRRIFFRYNSMTPRDFRNTHQQGRANTE